MNRQEAKELIREVLQEIKDEEQAHLDAHPFSAHPHIHTRIIHNEVPAHEVDNET